MNTGEESAPLVERWNGWRWSIVRTPASVRARYSPLGPGVACADSSDCWVVGGTYTSKLGQRTLVEHWDGSHWSVVRSPNGQGSYLVGIACSDASMCMAVGAGSTNVLQSLAEEWNGSTWSIVSSPSGGQLLGVACSNAAACMAVGGTGDGGASSEQWNGQKWSLREVLSPAAAVPYSVSLSDVVCPSISDCTAVGNYSSTSSHGLYGLIEHWDGSEWSIIQS